MTTLRGKHWAIVCTMLAAIGTQLAGMDHGWHDAQTPTFIGGVILSVATTLGALFTDAPHKPYDGVDRRTKE